MKRILYILMAFAVAAGMTGCGDGESTPAPDPGPTPDPDPDPTPSTQTYSVGDYYAKGFIKGIVFQVDETGEHGYVLSLDEESTVWSYKNEDTMSGIPSSNGQVNCRRIQAMEGWMENYPGFLWAYNLNVMGLENWYIPSGSELSDIFRAYTGREPDETGEEGTQSSPAATSEIPADETERKAWFNACITAQGGTPLSDDLYWTSDEMGPAIAYPFDMRTGNYAIDSTTDTYKNQTHRFRAISKF